MKWKDVERDVKATHKTSHRRIEFRLATKQTLSDTSIIVENNNHKRKASTKEDVLEDAVSGPVPGLCDPNAVTPFVKWNKVYRNAPGMHNQGNTCYLNSTLQCLLHVPALSQYLLEEPLQDNNRNGQRSILDIFKKLVVEVWTQAHGKAISPRAIYQNIRRIAKHFRPTRQEDAHEFLRLFLDCMHEEILKSKGLKTNNGGKLVDTTLIGRIFGGYLRNELCCSKCNYKSRTYNHFQDLCLDLQGIRSVKESIDAFVKPEVLGRGNEWHCDKCNRKVQATKQLTISRGPLVLVLQLKRFSFGDFGGKITKQIAFPVSFRLPLSDDGGGASAQYELCGVVVHHGGSVHSGHYVAFVRAPNKTWLEMNDSSVSVCSEQRVLSAQAYILFYSRSDIKPQVVTPVVPEPAPVPSLQQPDSLTTKYYDSLKISLRTLVSWMIRPLRFKGMVGWFWTPTSKLKAIRGASSSPLGSPHSKESVTDAAVKEEPVVAAAAPVEKMSVVRMHLNQAKRGRDLGVEGQWDELPGEVQRDIESIKAVQKKAEKRRVSSDWDRQLDQGRMKKVKGKKDNSAFFSGANAFQAKLDRDRDRKSL